MQLKNSLDTPSRNLKIFHNPPPKILNLIYLNTCSSYYIFASFPVCCKSSASSCGKNPNPLTQQLSFYNNVLTEIYGSSFEIMAPLQFKDYVTSQRITRWKIEKDVTHLNQKVQNVLNSESKDGRAQNVARFSSEVMRTVRPGDSFKAESCKKVIQQMLDEVTVKLQEIVNLRSNLFDKNLIVKQWRANELKFLDSKKSSLEELKNTLQKRRKP